MLRKMRDGVDLTELLVLNVLAAGRRRLREALARPLRDHRGQTPTEYLMIVGLMAVVIVTAFVLWFWPNVQGPLQQWVKNVKDSILGSSIK